VLRETDSQAYRLLSLSRIDVPTVRASIIGYATGAVALPDDPDLQTSSASEKGGRQVDENAPSPISLHPSLDRKTNPSSTESTAGSETRPQASGSSASAETERRPWGNTSVGVTEPEDVDPAPEAQRADASDTSDSADPPDTDDSDDAIDQARKAKESLASRLFDDENEQGDDADAPDYAERDTLVAPDAPTEPLDLTGTGESTEPREDGVEEDAVVQRAMEAADDPWNTSIAEVFELDEDVFPTLAEFGRNLTRQAALGRIDPVIGRRREILNLIDIVGKRRSNNPMLVGEPGVGKTAVVEGLARSFVQMAHQGQRRGERLIVELELGRMLSGTQLRGSLSERLLNVKEEVARADGSVIVFLDEIHAWMDAGGSDGGDATGELKTAMARGAFPCIGATTNEEFRNFVEADPAFQRRFQIVTVEEPSRDTALEILRGVRSHYEDHHGIDFEDEALEAAVDLSRRYIHDRRLPDKAIGVLDLAGSRGARTGQADVGRRDVAKVVAEMAGLPADRLLRDNRDRYLNIETALREHIVGQRHIIDSVSEVVRRNYAGFRGRRPIGSFLFLGPTGVGKTETVKALAEFLFHDREAVVEVDMSEYMESHSVSRFTGAPPGYVGHDQGGQLTEAVRQRPYQVVLLDEIEKAHRDVLNLLLQLFEEGRLTDGKGREVDFSNTLIIMTSNLGADVFEGSGAQGQPQNRIGFGAGETSSSDSTETLREEARTAAREHFSPELWNRIDETLVFDPLSREEVKRIASLQLEESRQKIADETGIDLSFADGVVDYLIDHGGWDPDLGARPMRQAIQREVESIVATRILEADLGRGDGVEVICRDGELTCRCRQDE
jgi:ATP-dependent Clp protease ATP-binding subunit ClpC